MNYQQISKTIPSFKSEGNFSKYIYLLGGVHGDEPEGVYVVEKIFEYLQKHEEIQTPFVIIPLLNSYGFKNKIRVNENGIDLNRNLPSKSWSPKIREKKYHPGPEPLSEKENKFLVNTFDKYTPGFIISFHSWKPMLNYNGNCKEIAEFISTYNSYVTCDDIEGHPTPGSLGDFAPQNYNSPVLTYELPNKSEVKDMESIWMENQSGLFALLHNKMLNQFID